MEGQKTKPEMLLLWVESKKPGDHKNQGYWKNEVRRGMCDLKKKIFSTFSLYFSTLQNVEKGQNLFENVNRTWRQ
jgi:hypothetical protein